MEAYHVVVTGPAGSGKTTLIDRLCRDRSPRGPAGQHSSVFATNRGPKVLTFYEVPETNERDENVMLPSFLSYPGGTLNYPSGILICYDVTESCEYEAYPAFNAPCVICENKSDLPVSSIAVTFGHPSHFVSAQNGDGLDKAVQSLLRLMASDPTLKVLSAESPDPDRIYAVLWGNGRNDLYDRLAYAQYRWSCVEKNDPAAVIVSQEIRRPETLRLETVFGQSVGQYTQENADEPVGLVKKLAVSARK